MSYFNELSGEQRRQLIDAQQVYNAWRATAEEKRRRFTGGMRWKKQNGAEYLLRKIGDAETSLGPRSIGTEAVHEAFIRGRAANREKIEGLSRRLDELAPVNRAMGLGRVPEIAARIVRRCDEAGLLGSKLFIVGTNALFAYEALAGVRFESGLIATGDIDLLFDARRRLSLGLAEEIRAGGLMGLLKQVDRSFSLPHPRSYRAANKDGYTVDLIRPQPGSVLPDVSPPALTDLPDDMEGAAVFGLGWLVNAPKTESVALDERGYPVRLVVVDPRAFALHKAWLAERKDRDPVKSRRDHEQALAAAILAIRYLRLPFDSPDLTALPTVLRDTAPRLVEQAAASGETDQY